MALARGQWACNGAGAGFGGYLGLGWFGAAAGHVVRRGGHRVWAEGWGLVPGRGDHRDERNITMNAV